MSRGFMLIDGNNVGHASQSKKILRVGDVEVQAVYHFLRTMRSLAARFPLHQPIVLWDGPISWRKRVFADYKSNRDKSATSKHEKKQRENRVSYARQRPLIQRGLEHLGVKQLVSANLEADDLAAILCRKYQGRRILLITGDKDWVQLIGPTVTWLSPVGKPAVLISPRKIKEILGVEDARAWLDVKCIQGDVSDAVPGVGGIGEKGAIELVNRYGSVLDFYSQVMLEKSIAFDALPKKFRDLVEQEEKMNLYRRNRMLMDLNHPAIPKPANLTLTKGGFNPKGFAELCRELLFKSMLTDVDGWTAPFNPNSELQEPT